MEKKLLYYERYVENKFRLNDTTLIKVVYLICKDVKTGGNIILGLTLFPKEVSKSLAIAERYYDDINKLVNDYDLLWNLTKDEFSTIPYFFEDVQTEYYRLVNDNVKSDEINSVMIKLFQEQNKVKK